MMNVKNFALAGVILLSFLIGVFYSDTKAVRSADAAFDFFKSREEAPASVLPGPIVEEGNGPARSSRELPSFVELVKQEKPAVVNISTTQVIKRQGVPHPRFNRRQSPFDEFFGDDFFRRFFGDMPEREFKSKSLGSGFIIDKEGHILTNNHVIENATEIMVKLSTDKEYEAKIVGRDPKTDIALIKIDAKNDLPVVDLGDSDTLEIGEWVMAIGNPFGLEQTVTAGIVSAKGRVIGSGPYDDFIQTDASINPGNSGGPLFNIRGQVVGINTAIVASGQGIGFAIPINMALSLVPQLKETGKVVRGWLGVMIQQITDDLADSLGLETSEGALVAEVVEDGPAAKAGIKRGDVILEFNGEKIGKMRDLPSVVASTAVGRKVPVKVLRQGKTISLDVKVGELEEEKAAETEEGDQFGSLGMTVQEITPELAEYFQLDETEGLVVSEVEQYGPAAEAGLRRGDIILEVNQRPVTSLKDYRKALEKKKAGESSLFWVRRGSNTLYFAVRSAKE
ncbi:MAG: DegQ family serine endoprotease [bacterium]|nr:DegQ family serine endoprotease [bacterium]